VADPQPLLRVEGVKKHFGAFPALKGVTFDVAAGEFVAVVGPNGAGKSTLFNCIALTLRPSAGAIAFRGRDIHEHADEFRSALGYISHQLFLYGELSAWENLEFFARLYGLADPGPRIDRSLETMGLFPFRHRPVRAYSRGMKQRLAIARALLHDPAIVLLDEPFTGLDQHAAAILHGLLLRLRAEGKTVLLVSHQLEHALELGDRILILAGGRIRSDMAADEARRIPFREHYLETVARAGGES
jgi:heme exporter protein A